MVGYSAPQHISPGNASPILSVRARTARATSEGMKRVNTAPRKQAGPGEPGFVAIRLPSIQAPAPRSATAIVPLKGSSIHAAIISPCDSRATIKANGGLPAAKFAVPSRGSTNQTAPSSRSARSDGLSAVASSPTTRLPLHNARSRGVMRISASRSAIVTTSPGDFSSMSPAARARKRGMIVDEAVSRSSADT